MSETRPTLRDCPFCHTDGSNDEKIHFMGNLMIYDGGEYVASYTIFCTGCGIQLHDEYKDEIVRLWNGELPVEKEDEACPPLEFFVTVIVFLIGVGLGSRSKGDRSHG